MLIHSPKALAHFVSRQRKQQHCSQTQLGAQVGLKQTTVSKFEIKPETTMIETLFRILSALELEMHIVTKPNAKSTSKLTPQWTEEW